jgi:hypothetical protein
MTARMCREHLPAAQHGVVEMWRDHPQSRATWSRHGADNRLSHQLAYGNLATVAGERALGKTLHRLPGGIRQIFPRPLRETIRRSVGPFAPWEAGFTRSPPAARPGEVTGPPDFVGIGVQKAGTTWWWDLVNEHPGVFNREDVHKERHYFTRFAFEGFGLGEARSYQDWFPRPSGAVTGEWTPDYFSQPWVPPLLASAAPQARLLVILRDPVERFVSGLAHSDLAASDHLGNAATEAFVRGLYANPLRAWSEHFGADRMLVLQYEQCVADPAGELARTYAFLGLDTGFEPASVNRPRNPTAQKTSLHPDARRRLVELYSPDVEETMSLLPGLDIAMWHNFAQPPAR